MRQFVLPMELIAFLTMFLPHLIDGLIPNDAIDGGGEGIIGHLLTNVRDGFIR